MHYKISDVGKEVIMSQEKTKKPFYKKWWFIVIAMLILLGIVGSLIGPESTNKNQKPTKNTEDVSVESIIKTNFKDSEVKIELDKETNNLYLDVKTKDYATADGAFNVEGGNLARCVGEVMKFNKDINWQDVSISCETHPNIITCIFNADAVKSISDWSNFTQSDIKSVCDAYSDCTQY